MHFADVLVFVHSHYYITVEMLVAAIRKTRLAYVVCHRFDGGNGVTGFGEGYWERRGHFVKHSVKGSEEPYLHRDGADLFTDVRLSATHLRTFGSTTVWRVVPTGQQMVVDKPLPCWPVGRIVAKIKHYSVDVWRRGSMMMCIRRNCCFSWCYKTYPAPRRHDWQLSREFVGDKVRLVFSPPAEYSGRFWESVELPTDIYLWLARKCTSLAGRPDEETLLRNFQFVVTKYNWRELNAADMFQLAVCHVVKHWTGVVYAPAHHPVQSTRVAIGASVGYQTKRSVCLADAAMPIREGASLLRGEDPICKTTIGLTLVGPVVPWPNLWVPRLCSHNELNALTGRALMVVPVVEAGFYDGVRDTRNFPWVFLMGDDAINRFLPRHECIMPLSWDECLATLPARRKRALIRHKELGIESQTRFTMFVKEEKYLKKTDCRPIQTPNDQVPVTCLPYLRPLNKLFAGTFGKEFRWTYASGMNQADVGSWFDDLSWQYIEVDAHRFDAHVSVEALQMTYTVFENYGVPAEVMRLLRETIETRGLTQRGRHRYTVSGTRKSGVPDTSLGNSLITIYLWWKIYCVVRKPLEVIVMGDDCVARCAIGDYDADIVQQVYTRGGFVPKVHLRDEIHDVGFLSGYIVPTIGGMVWTITLGRFLTKFFWAIGEVKPEHVRDTATVMATSIKPLVTVLPIAREIVERVLQDAPPVKYVPRLDKDYKPTGVHRPYDELTLHWFKRRYSLTDRQFDLLIEKIKRLPLQAFLTHSFFVHVAKVDLENDNFEEEGCFFEDFET